MGTWPVYSVWPMPGHFIFESSNNWLNTHKADWRWPIIILLIGRNGQSRAQRALAGGFLDFTHRIQIPQCTLGFVKLNYWTLPWGQPSQVVSHCLMIFFKTLTMPITVLKLRTICHTRDLWKLFLSCKHCIYYACQTHVTSYCLIQWISKLPGNCEVHWIRQ